MTLIVRDFNFQPHPEDYYVLVMHSRVSHAFVNISSIMTDCQQGAAYAMTKFFQPFSPMITD